MLMEALALLQKNNKL